MIYALMFMTALCTGLIGYIIGGGKPIRHKAEDTRTLEQKEKEKALNSHIESLMNYNTDQAYNKAVN